MIFEQIPVEILYKIIKKLSYSSCIQFFKTNKYFYEIYINNISFQNIVNRKLKTKIYGWLTSYGDYDLTLYHACRKRDLLAVKYIMNICNQIPMFILYDLCKSGNREALEILLTHKKVIPDNEMLLIGCEYGHTEIVDLLLRSTRLDPSENSDQALVVACINENIDCVRRLLEDHRVSPNTRNDLCFRRACSTNSDELIELLLLDSRVNPAARDNDALIEACSSGNVNIVNRLLLIPSVQPDAQDNLAIKNAAMRWHPEIVRNLWKDPRVRKQHKYCFNKDERKRISLIVKEI